MFVQNLIEKFSNNHQLFPKSPLDRRRRLCYHHSNDSVVPPAGKPSDPGAWGTACGRSAGEHSSPLREELRWRAVGATCGRPPGMRHRRWDVGNDLRPFRGRAQLAPTGGISAARCRGDLVGAKSAFAPAACSAPIRTAPLPLLSKPNPLPLGFGLGHKHAAMGCWKRSAVVPRASTARPYGRNFGGAAGLRFGS